MPQIVLMPQQAGGLLMEVKFLPLEMRAEAEGVVEGYGSVFNNRDSYGDVVEPGAFAESIKARKPKMLWQHNMSDPIGVWDDVSEDARGLRVRGRLAMGTTRGREAYELVKMGALDGLSIGFRTIQDEIDGNTRRLRGIDLYEVSFVTMPANTAAVIDGVKSAADAPQVERAIRQSLGLSRREAKAFMARGMAGLLASRDADAGEADGGTNQRDVEAVKQSLQLLLERIAK